MRSVARDNDEHGRCCRSGRETTYLLAAGLSASQMLNLWLELHVRLW